ncbi:MAG: hypothetical protein SO064_07235 [Prevotella sp.]|nr:hypothetical protein [Prevotella sp.]
MTIEDGWRRLCGAGCSVTLTVPGGDITSAPLPYPQARDRCYNHTIRYDG